MSDDTCSRCGGPTRWVITADQGRRIELDPDPTPDGVIVPVTVDGHTRARVLTGDQLPAEGPAWQRHTRTCPESDEARKHRARTAPRCRVCTNPLDRELARREPQHLTHPACDTAAAAATVRAALHREAS
jgi:hypothetical protein